eukprot:Sdes_comp10978_c0_seq2m2616
MSKKYLFYSAAGIFGWVGLFKLYTNIEMKYTPAYRGSVIHAINDPTVESLLGTPISAGFWASGFVDPKKGNAKISTKLKGPKGQLILDAEAIGKRRTWTITNLIL